MISEETTNEHADGYTAEEKRLARQAKEYLDKHGVCLSWDFYEDHPPTPEVKEFILALEDIIDPSYGEEAVLENAIDTIEMEWLDGEDEEEE